MLSTIKRHWLSAEPYVLLGGASGVVVWLLSFPVMNLVRFFTR